MAGHIDWSASANAITREIERGFYNLADLPVFNIHAVLAATGLMSTEVSAKVPASYLTSLYPREAFYGSGLTKLENFEAAFTRTLHAKIAAGYPEAQAWLVEFVSTYARLAGARNYSHNCYTFRKLTLNYRDETTPMVTIFGNTYKSLMFRMADYDNTLNWFASRKFNRLLLTPAYLSDPRTTTQTFMEVLEIVLLDVYQWLLQGDSAIEPKYTAWLHAVHTKFVATLSPATEPVPVSA